MTRGRRKPKSALLLIDFINTFDFTSGKALGRRACAAEPIGEITKAL